MASLSAAPSVAIIGAGAMGYVMKQEAGEKVALAVQHLLRGEIYLSPPMKQKMLHRLVNKRGDRAEFAIDTLSNRELEVFRLIGNGFSTSTLAMLKITVLAPIARASVMTAAHA